MLEKRDIKVLSIQFVKIVLVMLSRLALVRLVRLSYVGIIIDVRFGKSSYSKLIRLGLLG